MKPVHLKVARIGNSRGVRLPAPTLRRYGIGNRLLMEEREDGILLKPAAGDCPKLSWSETARDMARFEEGWKELDALAADGLDALPWAPRTTTRAAEPRAPYGSKPRKRAKP